MDNDYRKPRPNVSTLTGSRSDAVVVYGPPVDGRYVIEAFVANVSCSLHLDSEREGEQRARLLKAMKTLFREANN
jgi:hypothetical protein